MEWWKSLAGLIGRILLVLIFLNSGIGKIGKFDMAAQYMARFGISYANLFLLGAIVFELLGSLTVILGYYARLGALLLILFLIPTTILFHTNFADPLQLVQFMKNLSMLGGCLVLLGMGPGDWSLDTYFRGRKSRR
jgi:putative oxidoreductase